jgi:hypothetical protein
MAEIYPGYNVDPRVRQVIDRCLAIGIRDFNKPYSNKEELFKFSTLERDVCRPAKVPLADKDMRKKLIRSSKPGVLVLKGIAHTSNEPITKTTKRKTATYRIRRVQESDISSSSSQQTAGSISDYIGGGIINI